MTSANEEKIFRRLTAKDGKHQNQTVVNASRLLICDQTTGCVKVWINALGF